MSAQLLREPGKGVAAVLFGCAAVLLPWIGYLAVTLTPGDYVVRRWGLAWVGLDIAEVLCLTLTALLVRRRDVRASPLAAATATLFLTDAWFDTVTSHTGLEYLQALGLSWVGELPLAALCVAVALRTARWTVRPNPMV
jgi:hypothetical protein